MRRQLSSLDGKTTGIALPLKAPVEKCPAVVVRDEQCETEGAAASPPLVIHVLYPVPAHGSAKGGASCASAGCRRYLSGALTRTGGARMMRAPLQVTSTKYPA